ncbi:MAG: hypothetical protein ABJX32_08305 [Tateyamaria sp.]|uniref:hypothetical protein n=1 Tax=Tateyamaria sp. TaxID=1929288 RepID=UPI00329C4A69
MQLVLHAGAHFTEEDRLLRCLLRNAQEFSNRGVTVPGPGKYRTLLKETVAALQDAPPAPDARDVLFDLILEEENADRVILSQMFLFGAPRACVRNGVIYESAPERVAQLAALFEHDEFELFLALRNPATLLPALFQQAPQEDMDSFLRGANPLDIKWSDTLTAIRAAAPTVKIIVWCFEDMPMIWSEIMREMAGLDHGQPIIGAFDLLYDIMSKEGAERFDAYIKDHPDLTEIQIRRVIAAFLDKFAVEDAIEEELDAPGWIDSDIDAMTEIYEDDMATVARIPGVTFIAP